MVWPEDFIDRVICGDCLEIMRQMPAESVHCVVTSPPYWSLRDYNVDGQLGLEPTPEEYIEKMVAVFREVRRILRKDGTLWLNMGDTYCGGGRGFGNGGKQDTNKGCDGMPKSIVPPGLKEKDLCMMPHRLAIALQRDGWWIRSDIVWHKPNPMPESCTDRPTKSHEFIFLCTKSAKYYYDADAIREPHKEPDRGHGEAEKNNWSVDCKRGSKDTIRQYNPAGRNKRSVWTIPTEATNWEYCRACETIYIGKERPRIKVVDDEKICPNCKKSDWVGHFATFPQDLVEPCIKAGTSEKGCCPECGAPWVRIVEKDRKPTRAGHTQKTEDYNYDSERHVTETKTIGWQPGCKCKTPENGPYEFWDDGKASYPVAKPIPCLVYDLFFGSGTVGLVAYKLNRHWLGTELNPEYVKIAEQRIQAEKDKYGLFGVE